MIASASAQTALEEQVRAQGIDGYFEALLGVGDCFAAGKEGLAGDYLAERETSGRPVFIGDTVHDWQVAAALEADCILVAGGHQDRQRLEATGVRVAEGLEQAVEWLVRGIL